MADYKKNPWLIYIIVGGAIYFMAFYDGGNNYNNSQSSSESCNPVWNPDSRYDDVTFCSEVEAVLKAGDIGCTGFHTHQQDGQTIYMSCSSHEDLDPIVMGTY
jgi:hypothetical protein